MVLYKEHFVVVTEEEEVIDVEIGHGVEEQHLTQAVINVKVWIIL